MMFFTTPKYMGWFGKLPSVGDFAGRGMSGHLQETIHQWIAGGMMTLVEAQPQEWLDAYLVAPVWHFVMNAGVWDGPALTGCIAPSVDKVGRYSPLLALRSFDKRRVSEVLPPQSRWLYQVDATLRRVIRDRLPVDSVLGALQEQLNLEDKMTNRDSAAGILNDLGIIDGISDANKAWFSWPDLPTLFKDRKDRSFWWSEPSPKRPPRQIIHSGSPDEVLFGLLMGGESTDE